MENNNSKFKNLYKKYVEFNKSNVGKAFNWGGTILLVIALFLTKTEYGRDLQKEIFRNDNDISWFKSDDTKYTSDDIDLVIALVTKKYPEFQQVGELEQVAGVAIAGLSDKDFDKYISYGIKQEGINKSQANQLKAVAKEIQKIIPEWKGAIEYEEILMMQGVLTAYTEDEGLFDYQESIEQSFKEVEEELSKLVEKEFDNSIVKEKEKPVKAEEVVEEKVKEEAPPKPVMDTMELETFLTDNYPIYSEMDNQWLAREIVKLNDDDFKTFKSLDMYLANSDKTISEFVRQISFLDKSKLEKDVGHTKLNDIVQEYAYHYNYLQRKDDSEYALKQQISKLENELEIKQRTIDALTGEVESLKYHIDSNTKQDKTVEATVSYNDVALSMLSATYDISHLTDKQKLIVSKGFQLKNEDKDRFIRDLIARDLVEMDFVNELELLIRESDSFEHETISIGQALSEL